MLKLTDTPATFKAKMLPELAIIMNKALMRAQKPIETDVKRLLSRILHLSRTYGALTTGDLGDMFGLSATTTVARVDAIVNTIVESIEVRHRPVKVNNMRLNGGLTIGILVADFSDILSLPESKVVDKQGNVLPWLEWLLIRGDQIIVAGYDVAFGPFIKSRSKKAVMIPDGSAVWRVPPEYSGIINDNWLTRTIDATMKILELAISRIVEKHIGAALNVV